MNDLSALEEAVLRCDLVIFTGGLGPTNDDITKKTFAGFFESKMIVNNDVLRNIESFFVSRGLPLTRLNEEQAEVPDNCEVLFNYHGTAPGMLFRYDGTYVVSFPGVPFEMKPLFLNELKPILEQEFKLPYRLYRTFQLAGIPESMMAEQLTDYESELPDYASLAYLPRPGILRLRLGVCFDKKEDAEVKLEQLSVKILPYIKNYCFSEDEKSLEEVVGDLLNEKGYTLSTAESCTGGTIAQKITSISGSSAYFKGSIVAYSNDIKSGVLEVPEDILIEHGAVSKQVVEKMSQNVRKVFKTDCSIASSGIAGPTGGSKEKPVGTVWISVSTPEKTIAKVFKFGEHRGRNIERASLAALDMLRKALIEK